MDRDTYQFLPKPGPKGRTESLACANSMLRQTLLIVTLIVTATGCFTKADGASTSSGATPSMIEFIDSVSDIDDRLSSSEMSEDLSAGWNDLKRDMRSVANDMVRDPNAVDVNGFRRRIQSFPSSFQAEMEPANVKWDRLIAAFDQLTQDVVDISESEVRNSLIRASSQP